MLQIGVCAITDGLRDLPHRVIAFGEGHDLVALDQGEDQSQGGADKADPHVVFHERHSFSLLSPAWERQGIHE